MPEISRFYGITIKMYFLGNEHNPPHIHAIYNKSIALIDIQTINVIEGNLPKRAERLVKEWIKIHKNEIIDIWISQKFKKIEPLN
ncbi:MAG: DUF4160 domain-containing protein [Clostridia bacterium]|nr:DUF4160 domain-containing protein [Clostridia bacterium]